MLLNRDQAAGELAPIRSLHAQLERETQVISRIPLDAGCPGPQKPTLSKRCRPLVGQKPGDALPSLPVQLALQPLAHLRKRASIVGVERRNHPVDERLDDLRGCDTFPGGQAQGEPKTEWARRIRAGKYL